jgi:membrane-associated phospholipid phosphatase
VNYIATRNRQGQLWLLAGVVVVAASFWLDNAVDAALDVTPMPAWKHFAWWCSKIGEGWVIAVWGIATALICLFARRPKLAAAVLHVALAALLIGLAATILRVLFGRTRPLNHDVPQGFYGVWHDGHWLLGKFAFSSFPSGHAATAMGLMAAAWLINRRWGMTALIYALAVTWSRIALQCHHLSDVLASTVLAIAGAFVLQAKLQPFVESQFAKLHRIWFARHPL